MFIQRNSSAKIGWEYYEDNVYTSGSPLAVNNARVQLTNDGLAAATNTDQGPIGHAALWSSDAIQADSVGEAFNVRVDFTCNPAGVSDYCELEFDIGGGGSIIVASRTVSFQKTGNTIISNTTALFAGSTFVTNGCDLYINTSNSGDSIDIFDISILIQKVY